jgi:hypothetical protein
MEARLYRLTIALSLLAAIGFGFDAALAYDNEKKATQHAEMWIDIWTKVQQKCVTQWEQKCTNEEREAKEKALLEEARKARIVVRDESSRLDRSALAAVGIPAGLFLLFFGGRWILTGSTRKSSASSDSA